MKTQNVESINTKVSPELLHAFEAACAAVGLTGYDVLQRMLLTFIRTASRSVSLSPALRYIIQDYGRYEDDSVKLIMGQDAVVLRAIYILSGKNSKRASAVMTNNEITNTDDRCDVNIHHIFDLILRVCFPDIHRHLSEMKERFSVHTSAAVIRQLIDITSEDMISSDIADLFSDNERTESGAQIYGRELCKQKKRRNIEKVKQLDMFEDQLLGQIFSRDQNKEEDEA